jgi:hypothetical protein
MDKPGGFSREPGHRDNMPSDSGEIQDVVVTLKGLGPEVSNVEPAPRRRNAATPAYRRALPILGVVIVCILAGFWYLMERTPVKAGNITSSANGITPDSAAITWSTVQPATSQVEYGTTSSYGILSGFNSSAVTAHSVTLTGLTPGTTYHYAALSTDDTGRVSTSADSTFTTGGAVAAAGTAGPAAISRVIATGITGDSVTITWTTDQPLTSQVAYGATTAYGSLSTFNPNPVTSHSVNLTALAPGTTYNFSVLSANSDGQISKSPNFTFTTSSVAGMPLTTKITVDKVTANSATINWSTDQPSTSQVEFGTTTAYGTLSGFGPSLVTTHSVTLNGLTAGTIYDAATLSANSSGQVGKSADVTFTTSAAPPVFSQVSATNITAGSARITWTTDQPSTSKVDYGASTAYGSVSDSSTSLTTSHSVILRGLTPGTPYNYSVTSTNAAGMQNSSPNMKFTTVTK